MLSFRIFPKGKRIVTRKRQLQHLWTIWDFFHCYLSAGFMHTSCIHAFTWGPSTLVVRLLRACPLEECYGIVSRRKIKDTNKKKIKVDHEFETRISITKGRSNRPLGSPVVQSTDRSREWSRKKIANWHFAGILYKFIFVMKIWRVNDHI